MDSTTDSDPSVPNTAHVTSDEDAAQDTDTVAVIEDVDLEITKTFADDEVTAGAAGTHTFDLVVENLGDSDADNVTIVDTAPAGLTFLSEDSANCSITLAGNLSCTFAHLAGNSSTTITVTYDVDSTVDAGDITNSATVTSDEDTDTASDTVAIVEDVQLSVDKSFTDDSVTAGGAGTHTFTLVVTNDGASDADNVLVTDAVDPRLVVSNVSAPAGVDCSASAGQSVSCSKDHLASGGSFTITVTYDVDSTEDSDPSVSNTAHVASDEDAAQDTDTVAITEDVELVVTKTFTPDSVVAGSGNHTFTIEVANDGDSEADAVDVTDTVDSALTLVSVAPAANCDNTPATLAAGEVDCSFAHIGAHDSVTITVTYSVASTVDARSCTTRRRPTTRTPTVTLAPTTSRSPRTSSSASTRSSPTPP